MENVLTPTDTIFLEKHALWIRSAMEFTILGIPPAPGDLVFIGHLAQESFTFLLPSRDFISIGELVWRCEHAAGNSLVYEVWLAEALLNGYRLARAMPEDDASRFIQYFKSYHCIEDEEALARDAVRAVNEAQQSLYGN